MAAPSAAAAVSGWSTLFRRTFQFVTGGVVAGTVNVLYHWYNLGEDIENIDYEKVAKVAAIGGSAYLLGRDPRLLIRDLPRKYNSLIENYPMITKSVTTGVTYALGDLLAQWIEKKQGHDTTPNYDLKRLAVFFGFGTIIAGPLYTIWFDKIDRLPYIIWNMKQESRRKHIESICAYAAERGVVIPPEVARTPELNRITYIGSKVLADQFIFSSIYTAVFFSGVGLFSGKTVEDSWHDVRDKFVPTYATDCAVWPLLQMVNFTVMPKAYRVLFVNTCNIAWNAFLSTMANAAHGHGHSHAPAGPALRVVDKKALSSAAVATAAVQSGSTP